MNYKILEIITQYLKEHYNDYEISFMRLSEDRDYYDYSDNPPYIFEINIKPRGASDYSEVIQLEFNPYNGNILDNED